MCNMEYLKDMPIAVLGGGAVGKTCAADMKLAGREVRLYDAMPFAATSLKDVDKTGILLDGVQRNKYCFERSGRAFLTLVPLIWRLPLRVPASSWWPAAPGAMSPCSVP